MPWRGGGGKGDLNACSKSWCFRKNIEHRKYTLGIMTITRHGMIVEDIETYLRRTGAMNTAVLGKWRRPAVWCGVEGNDKKVSGPGACPDFRDGRRDTLARSSWNLITPAKPPLTLRRLAARPCSWP